MVLLIFYTTVLHRLLESRYMPQHTTIDPHTPIRSILSHLIDYENLEGDEISKKECEILKNFVIGYEVTLLSLLKSYTERLK